MSDDGQNSVECQVASGRTGFGCRVSGGSWGADARTSVRAAETDKPPNLQPHQQILNGICFEDTDIHQLSQHRDSTEQSPKLV